VAPTAEVLIVSSPIRSGRASLKMAQDIDPSNIQLGTLLFLCVELGLLRVVVCVF